MLGNPHPQENNPLACTCEQEGFNETEMEALLLKSGQPKDVVADHGLWFAETLIENVEGGWIVTNGDPFVNQEGCCRVFSGHPARSVTRLTTLFDLERTAIALHQAENWKNLELKIHFHEKPGGLEEGNHLDLTLHQLQNLVRSMNTLSRRGKVLEMMAPCTKRPVWNCSLLYNEDPPPLDNTLERDLRLCLYRVCQIHTEPLNDFLLHIEEFEYGIRQRRVVLRMKEEEYQKLEDLTLLLTKLYGSGGGWVVTKSALTLALVECQDLISVYRVQVENLPFKPTGKKRYLIGHAMYLNNSMHCCLLKPDCKHHESDPEHLRFNGQVCDEMDQMRRRVEKKRTQEAVKTLLGQPNWSEEDPLSPNWVEPLIIVSTITKKHLLLDHRMYVNNSRQCYKLKPDCQHYANNGLHQMFVAQVEVEMDRLRKKVEERRTQEAIKALSSQPNWSED